MAKKVINEMDPDIQAIYFAIKRYTTYLCCYQEPQGEACNNHNIKYGSNVTTITLSCEHD